MKTTLLLAVLAAPMLLTACAAEPPPPVVINRYETRNVYRERPVSRRTTTTYRESRGSAEEFRAVERPGSFSEGR